MDTFEYWKEYVNDENKHLSGEAMLDMFNSWHKERQQHEEILKRCWHIIETQQLINATHVATNQGLKKLLDDQKLDIGNFLKSLNDWDFDWSPYSDNIEQLRKWVE